MPTPSPSQSASVSPSGSPSPTPSPTPTPSGSPSGSPSPTPTPTVPTSSVSPTPTPTPTPTPIPDLVLSIGPILPFEDRLNRPVVVDDLEGVTFVAVADAENVLHEPDPPDPPQLIVPIRGGGQDRYITLLAESSDIVNPAFEWTGIEQTFTDGNRSFADLFFPDEWVLPHLVTVNVREAGEQNPLLTLQLHIVSLMTSPPLTAIGIGNHNVNFTFGGRAVAAADTLEFDPNDVNVTMLPPPALSVMQASIRPHNAAAPDNDGANAQTGPRTIDFTIGGEMATVEYAMTIYAPGAAVNSLITILDRPAPDADRPHLPDAAIGEGNRTQAQRNRIDAVVNATATDGANGASTTWNAWTASDAALTIPPTSIDQTQIDILIEASVRLEHPNGNAHKVLAASPNVPAGVWRSFIRFLADEEGGDNVLAIHRNNAGTPFNELEFSTGLFQFLDDRAFGINFIYSGDGWSISIPILDSGILEQWKIHIRDVQDLAALRVLLANQGQIGDDWRADPVTSIRNLTRHLHTYYGRLEGFGLLGEYNANTRFRVDLTPPGRANFDPNAPSLGHGSQRDVYELFSVVHQLPGNAFGSSALFGAIFRAALPLGRDGWWGLAAHPQHPNVMNQAGEERAAAARQRYDADF